MYIPTERVAVFERSRLNFLSFLFHKRGKLHFTGSTIHFLMIAKKIHKLSFRLWIKRSPKI